MNNSHENGSCHASGSTSSGSPVAVPYAVSAASNAAALIATMPATRIGHITWRTMGRLASSRARQTSATASARHAITALVRDSIARNASGDAAIANGLGGRPASGASWAGSWSSSREALRTRNAPSIAIDSHRPSPVGRRAGSASTSTASATS